MTNIKSQRAIQWNKDNPERRRETERRYREKDPIRYLLHTTKYNAKAKGLEWNLSRNDIFIPEKCPVFNTDFKHGTWYAMSVDRIDSTKGYIPGNVQVISRLANSMKQHATNDELISFANWISNCQHIS